VNSSSRGTWRSWVPLVSTCVLAVNLVGCDAQAPATATAQSLDARPFVTQEALAALNSDGQFETELPNGLPYPTINSGEAQRIAVAVANTFGPGLRAFLEGERGGPIDFAALQAGRVFYAHSAYEQNLPAELPMSYRKAAGPFYLVTLTNSGIPVVSVAVSTYNTDIGIDNEEIRFLSKRHGQDFVIHGIPSARQHEAPLSPERAVQVAAEKSGARVAGIPQLQLLGLRQGSPDDGYWRLRLDRKVQVLNPATGAEIQTDEVFVSRDGDALRAERAALPPERYLDTDSKKWVEFRHKSDVPSSFAPFTLARSK